MGLFPPKGLLDADFIKILRLVEKIMVEGWISPHPPGGCTPERGPHELGWVSLLFTSFSISGRRVFSQGIDPRGWGPCLWDRIGGRPLLIGSLQEEPL